MSLVYLTHGWMSLVYLTLVEDSVISSQYMQYIFSLYIYNIYIIYNLLLIPRVGHYSRIVRVGKQMQ